MRDRAKNERYCETHDNYYLPDGKWIESQCPDPTCQYCVALGTHHDKDCARCLFRYKARSYKC
jgi:hypothetical protein